MSIDAGLGRGRGVQLGGRRQVGLWPAQTALKIAPACPPGSSQAKTVPVAPLLKDEAKCHGANSMEFCKFSYPPQQDDCMQSAVGH